MRSWDEPKEGTPKTLEEAISHAFYIGPMSGLRRRAFMVLKDYMAQAFNAAMLEAPTKEEEQRLLNLFKRLTHSIEYKE